MEQLIKDWAKQMVECFKWLVVKYEYSEKYHAFLVSFSPSSVIDDDEAFNLEAIAFNDKMVETFGDDAPLFTDEEKLFKLSEYATVISKTSYSGDLERFSTSLCINPMALWCESSSEVASKTLSDNESIKGYNNLLAIAA